MSLLDQVNALFDEHDEEQETSQNANIEGSSDTVNAEQVPSDTNTDNTSDTASACAEPSKPAQDTREGTNLFGEPVKESCGCAATKKKPKGAGKKNNSTQAAKVEKPKEPEHDLERLVVITAQNEQRTYPPELTLEEIRVDLERDFPAFSKENTGWHFEKQVDKERYLCIPTYKFSKAG